MMKTFRRTAPMLSLLMALVAAPVQAAPDCAALQSSPIYHVVNPTSLSNLLTGTQSEAKNAVKYGFTDDRGTPFYASLMPANELVKVHRLYHRTNGDFLWTINQSEIDTATRYYGYVYDGVNFFVSPTPSNCTQPVYRFVRGPIHRFAAHQADRKALTDAGWTNEGIMFYAGVTNPALGVNLGAGGITDWSSERVFADAMKTARPFGSVSAPWDSFNTPAPVDANGWPTGDAGVFVLGINNAHQEVKPHPSGTYKLYYKGSAQGSVAANGSKLTVIPTSTTNEYTADVQYNNKDNLFLTFRNIPGGVKDVRLIRPGNTASDVFDQTFLQRLKAGDDMFGIIRFMEATSTNGSNVAQWSDRTQKNYATQQRKFAGRPAHLAWEYVIELSNQSGKDPWINIPHKANDDYIRQLAILLKNTLNSDRKIYVEYSNEIWNERGEYDPFFQQYKDVSQIACANASANNYHWNLGTSTVDCSAYKKAYLARHTAWKLKQVSDIFGEVFGKEAMITRVRPVLAWHVWDISKDKPGIPGTMDDQLKYLQSKYGDPSKYIYAVSVGAYVDMLRKDGEPVTPPVNEWLLSVDDMFARMTDFNQNRLPGFFKKLRTLADTYGLKMFAYEGGQGLYGKPNFNNMLAAQNDPRMKGLVKTLLANWKNAGGDAFVHYGLVSSYGHHGFWGLSEQLEDENSVKWQAFKETAAEWRK